MRLPTLQYCSAILFPLSHSIHVPPPGFFAQFSDIPQNFSLRFACIEARGSFCIPFLFVWRFLNPVSSVLLYKQRTFVAPCKKLPVPPGHGRERLLALLALVESLPEPNITSSRSAEIPCLGRAISDWSFVYTPAVGIS